MSLKKQISIGAVWLIMGRLSVRLIGLVSTVILARLLVPEDFGLVAVAMTVVAIFEVSGAFGFDMALISNQNATRATYNAAWSMNVIRGLFISSMLLALSTPAAIYFDDPRLEGIFQALALAQFMFGLENIGIVDFRKNLEFQKEFRFSLFAKLSAFTATMIAAYILRDYWALIIGIVTMNLSRLALSYLMSPFRPRWQLSEWKGIMSFSKWLLVNNVFIFLNQRSIPFILTKMHGARLTGLFTVAEEIANLITTELVWPIQRAVFPGYAKISDDQARMRYGYLSVVSLVVVLVLPIGVGVAVCSEQLVKLFLGPKWLEIIPVIAVLAIAGAVNLFSANCGAVFMAVKQPRLITVVAASLTVVRLPALIYGIYYWELMGAAYAMLVTSAFAVSLNWFFVCRTIQLGVKDILRNVWRPALAVGTMWFALQTLQQQFTPNLDIVDNILQLALLVLCGGAVYIVVLLLLWLTGNRPDGAEALVLGYAHKKLQSLRNKEVRS